MARFFDCREVQCGQGSALKRSGANDAGAKVGRTPCILFEGFFVRVAGLMDLI